MTDKVDSEIAKRILAALEVQGYEWRTINGVAADTGLEADEVRHALTNLPAIVEAPMGSSAGERLFAKRERASASASLTQKAIGAVRSRLF